MQAYLYVFNTLSDWEWGFITAELNTGRFFKDRGTKVPVTAFSNTRSPVRTMGGITVVPEKRLDEISFQDGDILILPGGETWHSAEHGAVLKIAGELLTRGIPVAAICGATEALANKGLLDHRKHTSNGLQYIEKICPNYKGSANYSNTPAVTDGNLITASGVAPIDFTYHILKRLGVCKPATLEAWFSLFINRKEEHFFELIQSLQG
jgi:putative intracellular protease/amidase